MSYRALYYFFTPSVFVLLLGFSISAQARQAECKDVIQVLDTAFKVPHIKFRKLNDKLATRAIRDFIGILDPYQIFFLKSDVAKTRMFIPGIGKMLDQEWRKNNCKRFEVIHQKYKEEVDFVFQQMGDLEKFKGVILERAQQMLAQNAMGIVSELPKINPSSREEQKARIIELMVSGQVMSQKDGLSPEDAFVVIQRSFKRLGSEDEHYRDETIPEVIINSLIQGLDAHSRYLTSKEYAEFQSDSQYVDLAREPNEFFGKTHRVFYKVYPYLQDKLGYIQITSFKTLGVSQDVHDALTQMEKEKVSGVVLDLRNNNGGYLKEAIKTTKLFVSSDHIVRRYPPWEDSEEYEESIKVEYRGPLLVLVNAVTASAAEVMAGALKDFHRAVIIGVGSNRTYGKGSVQVRKPLEDFGAILITNSLYYTPKGHSPQKDGITADIVIEKPKTTIQRSEEFESSLPYVLSVTKVLPDVSFKDDARMVTPPSVSALDQYSERYRYRNEQENSTEKSRDDLIHKESFDLLAAFIRIHSQENVQLPFP